MTVNGHRLTDDTTASWRERLRAVKEPRGFGAALVALLALPALWAIVAATQDIVFGSRHFGANPVKEVEHYLGRSTLRLIVATLGVTPLRALTGWNWLAKHRRTLGLYAFAYLTLHWIAYAFLDVQLNWADLTKDLLKRPYIYLGMTALVLMVPLALTSTKAMIRRLGRNWGRLHRAVYVVAILGVIHYGMAVKKDLSDPIGYGVAVGALLLWRVARRRAVA